MMKYLKIVGIIVSIVVSNLYACTNNHIPPPSLPPPPQEKLLVTILEVITKNIRIHKGNSGIKMTCGGTNDDFACYFLLQNNIPVEEISPESKTPQSSY